MSPDLERAKASLAAGRRDEAVVYAWKALSTAEGDELIELRRLAAELGDVALQSELDRRAAPSVPPPAGEGSPDRGWLRAGIRVAAVPIIVLALLGFLVSQIPVEPSELHATAADTVASTKVRRLATVGPGVYLAPLGNVRREDVQALAEEVGLRYHVPTVALPPVALRLWTLDAQTGEFDGDKLIRLLQLTYGTRGQAAVIGITDYEMFSTSLNMHRLFSLRNPVPYGVVSSSTLAASLFDRLRGYGRHERVRKLIGRNIGFLYFRLPESSDQHSLLRTSMSSNHDIDVLREDLPNGSR